MNKNFETLEKVIIHMGDNFYQPVELTSYINKLEKEFAELMAEFENSHPVTKTLSQGTTVILTGGNKERIKDEMADVLVFLLRISNHLGSTGNDLLHHAATKMLVRVKDPHYNK